MGKRMVSKNGHRKLTISFLSKELEKLNQKIDEWENDNHLAHKNLLDLLNNRGVKSNGPK